MPQHESERDRRGRVSRRDFLKAAGAGAVLTPAAAAAVPYEESAASVRQRWDHEADVAVVGSGAAAFTAALFAREAGASVVMLEKAAIVGGTTVKSGGIPWIPNHFLLRAQGIADPREDCLRYMARLSYPTLYDPRDARLGLPQNEYELLATFYDRGASTIDELRAMGVLDFIQWIEDGDGLPAADYHAEIPEDKVPRGRGLIPVRPDGTRAVGSSSAVQGALLIQLFKSATDARSIPLLTEHRASRLVRNTKGEIVGLEAVDGDGRTIAVRARKGVIFGSGGFTGNAELCLNFLRGPVYGGCAAATNEGDFVHIAGAVGAKLANMNNAWWSSVILERALQSRSTPCQFLFPGDSMIAVNCLGRRVVSEKQIYHERTQVHFEYDPHLARYPNLILMVIYDEFCRERFGGTNDAIPKPGISAPYVLSGQTLEELTAAIEKRLADLAPHTGNYGIDAAFLPNLKDTIARFNQFAETGKDLDFHRGGTPIQLARHGQRVQGNDKPSPVMYPISATGPYYAVMVAGGTLDTNGGPKINRLAQVLDAEDQPIPGLYGAGNCIGSPAARAYWAGGATIGTAMTFGAIAGATAAAEPGKEPTD